MLISLSTPLTSHVCHFHNAHLTDQNLNNPFDSILAKTFDPANNPNLNRLSSLN